MAASGDGPAYRFEEKLVITDAGLLGATRVQRSGSSCLVVDRQQQQELAFLVWSPDGAVVQQQRLAGGGDVITHALAFELAAQKRPVLLLATDAADALVLVDRISGDVLQVLGVAYGIIQVVTVEDDAGAVNAVLACGTDGNVHAYVFDARGTLRRAKGSADITSWLRQALSRRATDGEPCADAIPIRLLVSDADSGSSKQHRHQHLLVGYSNGLLQWISVAAPTLPKPTVLPEIPAYKGPSSSSPERRGSMPATAPPLPSSLTLAVKRSQSDSDLSQMQVSEASGASGALSLAPPAGLAKPVEYTVSRLMVAENIPEEDEEEEEEEDEDEEKADNDGSAGELNDAEAVASAAVGAPDGPSPSTPPVVRKLLFDGAVSALCHYRLPPPAFGAVVALASGAVAIVSSHADAVERPLAVLPGSYQHGGALSVATAAVSCAGPHDDVFVGFQDGTVLLCLCDGGSAPTELTFTVAWSVALPGPVRHLDYGQLLDHASPALPADSFLPDQLLAVTATSCHLFTLSSHVDADFVDQFMQNLSFFS